MEHFLAPALRPDQLVVMDDLGVHKPRRVRELIEDKGCELIYLSSYSPDFNPPYRRLFRRSSTSSGRSVPASRRLSSRRWVEHWEPCVQKRCGGSSLTVATAYRRSNYDRCYQFTPIRDSLKRMKT